MLLAAPLLVFLLLPLALGGCSASLTATPQRPPNEMGPWMPAPFQNKMAVLAADEFSMEVVRFTDARRPRSLERGPMEQSIDLYDPDQLLQGITTRLPALYQKYLAYKPRMEKHYLLEFDVKELRTEVLTGSWLSGPYGRYLVKLEVEAIARRPDSQVVLKKSYTYQQTMRRVTYNGRSPSVAMDEARLTDLVDTAVRATSVKLVKDLFKNDADSWEPATEASPVPTSRTRLVPQPTLLRATGSQTGFGSDLIIPAEDVPYTPPVPVEDPAEPLPMQQEWSPRQG